LLVEVGTAVTTADPHSNQVRNIGKTVLEGGLMRYRELVARRPDDPALRAQLAQICMKVGALIYRTRSPAEAIPAWEEAATVQRRLVREHPQVRAYQIELARILAGLGLARFYANSPSDSLAAYRESLALLEPLAAAWPPEPTAVEFLASRRCRARSPSIAATWPPASPNCMPWTPRASRSPRAEPPPIPPLPDGSATGQWT